IVTDFPLKVEGSRVAYRKGKVTGWGALNGGGQVLKIRATAGDIFIHKLEPGQVLRGEPDSESRRRRLELWQKKKREKERKQREEKP
ncbi:MAG: hypothetical protein ACE5HB_04790, partial [Terriglobia bacterium]